MATPIEDCPHAIQFDTGTGQEKHELFTLDTHPIRDLVVTGDITGQINMYSYVANKACTLLRSCTGSKDSCRTLKFSTKGNRLFCGTAGKDIAVIDVETGQMPKCISNAHSAPLYSMLTVSERLFVSGDEKGEIKVWDTRTWNALSTIKESSDFISSMVVDDSKRTVLAACADGSLLAIDLRQRKLEQKSDCNESELLSLAIVKGGKKVVCGDGEGTLMIYNWGLWGDITDRYPCHPEAVDCMIPLNDSVICTGCMDGYVRSIQILPNQTLGKVGQQSTTAFSIDTMCMTHDREYVVTSSTDCCKFWSMSNIPTLQTEGKKLKREMIDRNDTGARKKKKIDKATDLNFFSDL